MERNPTTMSIARRVSSAIADAGLNVPSVAHAADITTDALTDRLNGVVEFEMHLLVRVGGVLRVPATDLLEVAA